MLTLEQLNQELFKGGFAWQAESGEIPKYHPKLSSGLHSNTMYNIGAATADVRLRREMAKAMAKMIVEKVSPRYPDIDWLVCPGYSSVQLVAEVARLIGAKHSGFTDKTGNGSMACRFNIKPGEKVLPFDDAITTGRATSLSLSAIMHVQPDVVLIGDCYCVVSYKEEPERLPNVPVSPLIRPDGVELYHKESCLLCEAGSLAIAPKINGNWNRLLAQT